MLPAGTLEILDARIDARIGAALTAFKPEVQEALKGAMEQIIVNAQKTGAPLPGLNPTTGIPEGGVVPGSPVTPLGATFMQWMLKGTGGGSTDMENLAKTLTQARAISDVLNPPTIWDRVMQNAVLRSLSKAGLVTESEMKELIEAPKKT